jgi:hypothetical protein
LKNAGGKTIEPVIDASCARQYGRTVSIFYS